MPVQRIPLVGQVNTRGINAYTNFTTYDQLYQNVIFVPVENELEKSISVYVEKRPGFGSSTSHAEFSTDIYEIYDWESALVLAGLNAGVDRVSVNGSTVKTHAAAGSGVFYFSDTTDSSGTRALIWNRDNTDAWIYPDAGSTSQIMGVPSGFKGPFQHLDGWTFIGSQFPARIYQSNLNDPTTGYTDYISCDTIPDSLMTTAKHGRFILGMGLSSIEWLVNNGNATGSVLSRINDPGIVTTFGKIGVAGQGSVINVRGDTYFISHYRGGFNSLYVIRGTSLTKLSSPTMDRIITQYLAGQYGPLRYAEFAGIEMIILCVGTSATSMPNALVYFPQTKLWSYWTSSSLRFSTIRSGFSSATTQIVASAVTTLSWSVSSPSYTDNGTSYTRLIRTAASDFGTPNFKTGNKLTLIGDRAASTTNISVRWTDDDYANYSAARTIDMAAAQPKTHRLGRFARRAFEVSDTASSAQRLQAMELDYTPCAT